ncbi:site-specific DNA-methyltransferase [Treponema parvum]|uniref:site-specific DNA-methyltransferase n=1 Tax=Treponema parvum TaxID=138851 RepID=UPI00211F2438|nr:site-specific DNA-methyltransferase [Treponema parvum]
MIKDCAERGDIKLLSPLLKDTSIKKAFFTPVLDSFVFNTARFKEFLEYSSACNSCSKYLGQKIGLYMGDIPLIDRSEVVLNFPFKDCVLEGGQRKEDGLDTYFEYDDKNQEYTEKTSKRREVFYNEVLARDEIDSLFSPKAFCNAKRYEQGKVSACKKLNRDAELNKKRGLPEDTITDNLIIKGNNLLALHSLKEEFTGKVKLIYIDPPYNTGSAANTFAYNNNFNHSSWLIFIKNRLEVAKNLLSKDGCIIIAIDENEHPYLGVLLSELFYNYEIHNISIIHNPRGIQGTNFSYTNEYAYFIIPKGKKSIIDRKIANTEIEWSNLRNWGTESERKDARNCFYPVIVDKKTLKIIGFGDVADDNYHPFDINIIKNDKIYVYPIDSKGIERKWRYARQSVDTIKHLLRACKKNNSIDIEIGKDFGQYKTVWADPRYDANEYGTKLVKDLVPECPFSFPKSLWNVYDCCYSVVGKDKNAIVLDFFGGSGTTAHAVEELNKDDSGNRQFILCEQMDYIDNVTVPRVTEVQKRNGGGSFVYMELAEKNEQAVRLISACKNLEELISLFDELCSKYFLHYNVRIKEFREEVKTDRLQSLTLKEQKEMFCRMLDLNQLYVNANDRHDGNSGLSTDDVAITEDFYRLFGNKNSCN